MAVKMFAKVDTPYDEGRKYALGNSFFEVSSEKERKDLEGRGVARKATDEELKIATVTQDVTEDDREVSKSERVSSRSALERALDANPVEKKEYVVDKDQIKEQERKEEERKAPLTSTVGMMAAQKEAEQREAEQRGGTGISKEGAAGTEKNPA